MVCPTRLNLTFCYRRPDKWLEADARAPVAACPAWADCVVNRDKSKPPKFTFDCYSGCSSERREGEEREREKREEREEREEREREERGERERREKDEREKRERGRERDDLHGFLLLPILPDQV